MNQYMNIRSMSQIPMMNKDIIVVDNRIEMLKRAFNDTVTVFEPRGIISHSTANHSNMHIFTHLNQCISFVPNKDQYLRGRKPYIKIPIEYYRLLLDRELERLSDPQ